MPFRDSSNYLERAEGVEALAMKGTQFRTVLLLRDLADALQEISLRRTMGIDENLL